MIPLLDSNFNHWAESRPGKECVCVCVTHMHVGGQRRGWLWQSCLKNEILRGSCSVSQEQSNWELEPEAKLPVKNSQSLLFSSHGIWEPTDCENWNAAFDLIFGLSQYPWDLNLNLQESLANFLENLVLLTPKPSLPWRDLQSTLQLVPTCVRIKVKLSFCSVLKMVFRCSVYEPWAWCFFLFLALSPDVFLKKFPSVHF